MLKEKRHTLILEFIRQNQLATISDLSRRLDASYMTIWRDLETLERQGLLKRLRGGAAALEAAELAPPLLRGLEPGRYPSDEWKLQIGRYTARKLVEEGDDLTIEAGTTASSIAPFLMQSNLTVLTNGLLTAGKLYSALQVGLPPNLTVMCSGGILIETGAFTGPQAEDFFTKFRVKKAFLGAKGVSLEDGFTDPTPLYMRLKSVMKQNTERVIMLLDSSKFGVRSLVQVMRLDEVDALVTDPGAPPEFVAALRARGIDVLIAEP